MLVVRPLKYSLVVASTLLGGARIAAHAQAAVHHFAERQPRHVVSSLVEQLRSVTNPVNDLLEEGALARGWEG